MTENNANNRNPGLHRRMLAIVYDSFLLLALLFIATGLAMFLNNGEAIEPGSALYPFYIVYLLAISFLFYGWFWTHGGQTLGMKTWKMQLKHLSAQQFTWKLALIRFIVALCSWLVLGLGFLWSLFEAKRRTWHDIASQSVVIDLRAS